MSMTKTLLQAVLVPALAAGASAAFAADHDGPIRVSHPWIRATSPGAPTAAGYVTLTNTGHSPDRLVGAYSSWASSTELHQTTMANGIMSMQPLPNGLDLPAGRAISFSPGGYHIMFVRPAHAAKIGEHIPVTLTFARATAAHVHFVVESGAPTMSGMAGMKMPGM